MEPTIDVHLEETLTHDGERLASGLFEAPLCVASCWLSEAKAHLVKALTRDEQAKVIRWMQKQGVSLGFLSKGGRVSKSMLSAVANGKKRLSYEKLTDVLAAYGSWVKEHGCSDA